MIGIGIPISHKSIPLPKPMTTSCSVTRDQRALRHIGSIRKIGGSPGGIREVGQTDQMSETGRHRRKLQLQHCRHRVENSIVIASPRLRDCWTQPRPCVGRRSAATERNSGGDSRDDKRSSDDGNGDWSRGFRSPRPRRHLRSPRPDRRPQLQRSRRRSRRLPCRFRRQKRFELRRRVTLQPKKQECCWTLSSPLFGLGWKKVARPSTSTPRLGSSLSVFDRGNPTEPWGGSTRLLL